MKPKPQPRDAFELFQAHFNQLLNPRHELILLAGKLDWLGLEAAYADTYCPDIGAPAIGHLKSDHWMDRCFPARLAGDAINAVPAAAGSNLRKLPGLIRRRVGRFVLAPCGRAALPACALIRRLHRLTANRPFDRLNDLVAA